MKKWEKRLLAIVTVLAMLAVSCFASAIEPAAVAAPAQDVCQGNREGTVNGLPACVNEAGDLHVCADNFPDDNFRAYLLESLAAIYEGLGLPYTDYFTADILSKVTSMEPADRDIASLEGVEYFSSLHSLLCDGNQLAEMDLSHNAALETLSCTKNQLTSLDLSGNPLLRSLHCSENQLTSLDVSQNPQLTVLICPVNEISELDLSGNPELQTLYCYRNRLRRLDLSDNPLLTADSGCIVVNQTTEAAYISADNQWVLDMAGLVSAENLGRVLSVSDGEYDPVTGTVTLSFRPAELTYEYDTGLAGCPLPVKVTPAGEEPGHEGMDGIFAELPACVDDEGQLHICAKNFPDANFRDYLLAQPGGEDGYISQGEANGTYANLLVSGLGIRSLAGIEYFSALRYLSCDRNQLTELDVSHNPALRDLSCSENQLTELDCSGNPALESLICPVNRISKLDVSGCPNLTTLYCYRNRLRTLDLSGNPLLTSGSCIMNQEIQAVYTAAGDGWVLDMAALVSAENLGRVLSVAPGEFDSVSGLVTLQNMEEPPYYLNYTYDTGLSGLSLSVAVTPAPETGGPEELDGVFAGLPACVNQSGDLHICEKNFPDANFRTYLLEQEGGADGYFTPAEAGDFTSFSVDEMGIASLAGLGYFPGLTELSCEGNALTELDLSSNSALTRLYCGGNQLTALNVSWCPDLATLYCEENRLTSLNVSGNTSLEFLNCGGNRLTSLDAGSLAALEYLSCRDNQLTALNIKGAAALTNLDCGGNQLAALDVSSSPLLESLDCINNRLTVLDVSANPALKEFDCRSNQLTTLDVSQNPQLELFICGGNHLPFLDLSGNPNLTVGATLLTQIISAEAVPAETGWKVDLSGLIPAEWLGQVVSVSAGTYDPATGIVSFDEEPDSFAYTIATGFDGLDMTVNVSLAGDILPGDMDGSGTVDIRDVMSACRILARQNTGSYPSADEIARGDLTGDGKIRIEDVMAICRILARGNM